METFKQTRDKTHLKYVTQVSQWLMYGWKGGGGGGVHVWLKGGGGGGSSEINKSTKIKTT